MHDMESSANDSVAETRLALAKRFPTTHVFFIYHAMKAKLIHLRTLLPRGWDLDSHRPRLLEEAELEWIRFDLYTAAEWAELRMRLLRGDETYLRSLSAAHLFRKGRARLMWLDGMGRSKRHLLFKKPSVKPWTPIKTDEQVCPRHS